MVNLSLFENIIVWAQR